MILLGDVFSVLPTLESESVDCVVTSPPYWGLRDYGVPGQLGLEPTPEQYVGHMRMVFEQVRRVLRKNGTLWLNLGDSYARNGGTQGGGNREMLHMEGKQRRMLKVPAGTGLKEKDLVGIPWRVAFALQSDGWYLRQDIIWHKPNPMPESVRDRCTKAHEYVFLLSKSPKYFFDYEKIKEPSNPNTKPSGNKGRQHKGRIGVEGWSLNPLKSVPPFRNRRSVWTITPAPFRGAHFATFPPKLIEPCILAGCPEGGVVLDPFFGAGTVGLVAKKLGRRWIGIELNPEYAKIAEKRIAIGK